MSDRRARYWDVGGALVSISLPAKLTPKQLDRLQRYVDCLRAEEAIHWEASDEEKERAK